MTAARTASPPPATIACPSCRASFLEAGRLPEHCPRCGWRLAAPSAARMHVFECRTSGCAGRTRFGAGWEAELTLQGCVWTCVGCGCRQVARIPAEESVYVGYVTEEEQRT